MCGTSMTYICQIILWSGYSNLVQKDENFKYPTMIEYKKCKALEK